MSFLPEDERHLQRALDLAAAASAFASPNPTVGCVLTRAGEVIGEGAHHYDIRDHAEIAALKDAVLREHSVRGATAYVTLEPCSHHGRTGPCADALTAAGIARCVVATLDANPVVSGNGIARMRAAGLDTIVLGATHPLAQQARRLNDAFAFSIQHGRPFVTLKSALSVDGKLAPAERSTIAPHWLTGPAAREDVQRIRHASDAILTGIGTVLADNPSLTDRTGLPRRRPLLRVVLDASLRVPLDSHLIASAADDLLIVAHTSAPQDAEDALRARGVEVLRLGGESGRPSPEAALTYLQQQNIRSVLLEAGAAVNSSFLQRNLVDRVILYFSETELGPRSIPFASMSPFALQDTLTNVTRITFPHGTGEDVRVAGYIHDPWRNI